MWSSTLLMSSLLFYSYGGGPAVLIRSYFVKLTCGKSRVVCKSWPEPVMTPSKFANISKQHAFNISHVNGGKLSIS